MTFNVALFIYFFIYYFQVYDRGASILCIYGLHILFFLGGRGGGNNFESMVHSCEMIQFVNFPGSAKYFWWGANNF